MHVGDSNNRRYFVSLTVKSRLVRGTEGEKMIRHAAKSLASLLGPTVLQH
jgi:hypothetical protein